MLWTEVYPWVTIEGITQSVYIAGLLSQSASVSR